MIPIAIGVIYIPSEPIYKRRSIVSTKVLLVESVLKLAYISTADTKGRRGMDLSISAGVWPVVLWSGAPGSK